ncbi:MAG: MltA domain-containing protein [Desulfarculaceae bacterium]|nr:MltA domain-containing protein [Desulfarculaceae bacterium]MCF8072366.1 MltA domain-containing protein [Desulfarculaceae bacterium]MCF8100287.1 MltA domain-containing protein [Desulfarculaceae bacterium]MCF8116140.1 MltA domain-containing protein [Desulfarculaceae bacterium]
MNTPAAFSRPLFWACLALAGLLILAACGKSGPPPKPTAVNTLRLVPQSEWPLLLDDLDAKSFFAAAESSLAYLRRVKPDKRFTFGPHAMTAAQMAAMLDDLKDLLYRHPDPVTRSEFLRAKYVLLESVGRDGEGEVLMTGYYEPLLQARRMAQGSFEYPVYALPEDLVWIDLKQFSPDLPKKRLVGQVSGHKVKPYPDREAIDFNQALEGKAEVLGYVGDPVEVFFLHIQGSGQLEFGDGSRQRVGYAASNGQPYRSIGRMMLREKLMEPGAMSMQGIKAYLEAHPEQRRKVLAHNPSYVFFRPLPATGGPLGCFEQPLTAGRSIATDRRLFPGLALGFVSGTMPASGGGQRQFSRFVFNQDTGGAIRGPGRLDLFFGTGPQAGALAGRMKNPGRLYFFFPRELMGR